MQSFCFSNSVDGLNFAIFFYVTQCYSATHNHGGYLHLLSDTNLLSVPRVRTCFGSRSFSVAAPTIWNSLPFDIRNRCSIASFHRKLKTFYFSTSSRV